MLGKVWEQPRAWGCSFFQRLTEGTLICYQCVCPLPTPALSPSEEEREKHRQIRGVVHVTDYSVYPLGHFGGTGLVCADKPMKNKTLAHEWFDEVWNKNQINAIDRLLAEDAIAHGLFDDQGRELRGTAGFKRFFLQFTNAFPDIHVEVADTISEGDKIAARCIVTGTHRGDSLGIAASNKPIQFTGIAILRVKDGKIVEGWNNFDFQGLSQQIGAAVQADAPGVRGKAS